jgi:hypothetical protein
MSRTAGNQLACLTLPYVSNYVLLAMRTLIPVLVVLRLVLYLIEHHAYYVSMTSK